MAVRRHGWMCPQLHFFYVAVRTKESNTILRDSVSKRCLFGCVHDRAFKDRKREKSKGKREKCTSAAVVFFFADLTFRINLIRTHFL